MPARRELHTGRYNFLHRSWGPVEPYDNSMPEILKMNGIYSHLTTDHWHYFQEGGATYHTRYQSWEYNRGQEGDPWKGHVHDPVIPDLHPLQSWKAGFSKTRQDWINREYIREESNFPCYKTFQQGIDFLENNHDQENWFLHVETFDPHEPFFAPEKYRQVYQHSYGKGHFDWPQYTQFNGDDEDRNHILKEYAASVSMCDAQLGRLLDAMDRYSLWENTLLIVTSDHGYAFGEHGWWAKNKMPWYSETSHIPFFVWDPRTGKSGDRDTRLTQWIDIAPTLLEYFNLQLSDGILGIPLQKERITPILFGVFGTQVNICDGEYLYMRAPVNGGSKPLFEYTLMPTHLARTFSPEELAGMELAPPFSFTKGCRTMKVPGRPFGNAVDSMKLLRNELYDLKNDPGQLNRLIQPDVEKTMTEKLITELQRNDSPEELYARLGLPIPN